MRLIMSEAIINKHKLTLTNLDKIYFPAGRYAKGDVIDYYRKISKYILPYLKDRPESLHRYPNGIKRQSFYQKDVDHMPPEWAKTVEIYSESNDKNIKYLVCNDEATLIYMANLGCIEINPWSSRTSNLDKPDYLVIDLDPEEISFDNVIKVAIEVRKVFDKAGAKSFCKTSGATGLHIYVPLKAKYKYEAVREFAHLIVKLVNEKLPGITSMERSPSKRKKKVYLDYLQNSKGQTLAAPYSLRPKPGATVSTPLHWKEVKKGLSPRDFNIKNIFKRLERTGDIFKGVMGKGIDIERCLKNLNKV